MSVDVLRIASHLNPLQKWAKQCHAASMEVVRLVGGRVARGFCKGVGGQHSWAVIGQDCYAEDAIIVDPTLWSYDPSVRGIWIGTLADGRHRPHGLGSIWEAGRPAPPNGQIIKLKNETSLSTKAKRFLKKLGPLDRAGWLTLAKLPVGGWPAKEIIEAMDDTPELTALVPIDRLGMLTDRNPGGLYLPDHDNRT